MEIIHLPHSKESEAKICAFIKDNEYLLPDPFSFHVDLNEYSKKLNNLGETFAAVQNEKICGFVSGYINDFENKEAYLQILIVAQEFQKKKIGSNLVREFIAETKKILGKTSKVYLVVDSENQKAKAVYRHLGFVKSERNGKKTGKEIYMFLIEKED